MIRKENEDEDDPEDKPLSPPSSSSPSSSTSVFFFDKLLDFNPCTSACSNYSNFGKDRTGLCFNETDRHKRKLVVVDGTKGIMLAANKELAESREQEEPDNGVDILVDENGHAETLFYYHAWCSQKKEWRKEQAKSYKAVMNQLLWQRGVVEEEIEVTGMNTEELQLLKDLIGPSVNRERTKKPKKTKRPEPKNSIGVTRASKKSQFSFLGAKSSTHRVPENAVASTESKEKEYCSSSSDRGIHGIKTTVSSPKRLHYRFDDSETDDSSSKDKEDTRSDTSAERSRSLIKRSKSWASGKRSNSGDSIDNSVKVKEVAIAWH